jgi:hypothetical protein
LRALGIRAKKELPASFSQFEEEENGQDKLGLESMEDDSELDQSA